MSNNLTKNTLSNCFLSKKLKITVICCITALSTNLSATLDAITAKTIQGTQPYFQLNGSQVNTLEELETFAYKDSSGTWIFIDRTHSLNADSNNLITVPAGTKQTDIKAIVPITGNEQQLDTAIKASDSLFTVSDENGDAQLGQIGATGKATATFFHNNVEVIPSNDEINICDEYRLVVDFSNDTPVTAKTKFGDPSSSKDYLDNQGGAIAVYTNATYAIELQYLVPQTCLIGLPFYSNDNSYPVNSAHYDKNRVGYKPQTGGAKNFPTTGSDGLFFDLQFVGAKANDISINNLTSGSDIALELNKTVYGPTAKKVRMRLSGPNDSNKPSQAFQPTTFEIQASGHPIYRFTLEKWFIAVPGIETASPLSPTDTQNYWGTPGGYDNRSGLTGTSAVSYCNGLGYNYRLPTRLDLTNNPLASSPLCPNNPTSTNTNSCDGGTFTRAINGGLFSEWGVTYAKLTNSATSKPESGQGSGPYIGSDWELTSYWTNEALDNQRMFNVGSGNGYIYNYYANDVEVRTACVAQ